LNLIRVMPAKGQDNQMHSALTIARLVGPVMAVIGIGMLANQDVYRVMAGQFLESYPYVYFSGILAMVAGLAILNSHHVWTRDWRSLITAIGWIITGIGVFRVFTPQFTTFIAGKLVSYDYFFTVAGIILLVLGGFITFRGYTA